jgi:hypothetical protein
MAEMKMLDKSGEQSCRASNANEKPESCYCSALPKGVQPLPTLLYAMAGRQALVSNRKCSAAKSLAHTRELRDFARGC